MKNITGWGIPFVGCISLSLGIWSILILGGIEVKKAFDMRQNDHQFVAERDIKTVHSAMLVADK